MIGNNPLNSLRSHVSKFDEPLLVLDQDGMILFASEQTAKLLDQSALQGESIFHYVEHNSDKLRNWLLSPDANRFREMNVTFLKDGTTVPVKLRMFVWSVTKDGFLVCVTLRDSTFINRRRRDILRKILTIENLSRSRKIREGKLEESVNEILRASSRATNTERVNAWLFTEDRSEIRCIGNYDARQNELVPQESLPRVKFPNYFHLFETRRIIVSSDSLHSDITGELAESYLIPNDIQAMMDVPIRREGEIVGVLCFESVGAQRDWTIENQKFALITAQMVSLALETHERNLARQSLESELRSKNALLRETHHRIKNNLTILRSLLNIQQHNSRDDFHAGLFEDSKNRLDSIVSLHELLYQTRNFETVNLMAYLRTLVNSLSQSFASYPEPIRLHDRDGTTAISVSAAVSIGLIVNEIITNSFKHAFGPAMSEAGKVELTVIDLPEQVKLIIADNGPGFDFEEMRDTVGLEIVQGLVHQLSGEMDYSGENGSRFEITLSLEALKGANQ